MYFAYKERNSGSSTRTCISRQGRVRICSHAFLGWSDIEKASSKTLSLECGRHGSNGDSVLLKVETAGVANGAKRITVTIHTTRRMFQQTSWMTGTLRFLSPKRILGTIAKSAKDEAANIICPHASFNPEKWQMQLHPHHKRKPCDISPDQETVSKRFFGRRFFGRIMNRTASPFENLCPLCEMTTGNDASAIKNRSTQATHHDSCSQCSARYDWTWYSSRSSGHSPDSLELKTTRQFTVTKPTDLEWLRSLEITPKDPKDPRGDSAKITPEDATNPRGDPETKHLLWCDNELGTFVNWNTVARWARGWPWP